VRALPQRKLCEERCFLRRSLVEQRAAEWQHAGSPAVGEEAEVADTGKASRQYMQYESAAGTLRRQVSGCPTCRGGHSPSNGSRPQQLRPTAVDGTGMVRRRMRCCNSGPSKTLASEPGWNDWRRANDLK
jgi:hypothetical protein